MKCAVVPLSVATSALMSSVNLRLTEANAAPRPALESSRAARWAALLSRAAAIVAISRHTPLTLFPSCCVKSWSSESLFFSRKPSDEYVTAPAKCLTVKAVVWEASVEEGFLTTRHSCRECSCAIAAQYVASLALGVLHCVSRIRSSPTGGFSISLMHGSLSA